MPTITPLRDIIHPSGTSESATASKRAGTIPDTIPDSISVVTPVGPPRQDLDQILKKYNNREGGLTEEEVAAIRTQIRPKNLGWFRSLMQRVIEFFDYDDLGKKLSQSMKTLLTDGADTATLGPVRQRDLMCNRSFFFVEDRMNALMDASYRRHTNIARRLIERMTPEQIASSKTTGMFANGHTALMIAARGGSSEIVKALIEKTPRDQIFLRNENGYNAFDHAILGGNIETIRMFLKQIDELTPEQKSRQNPEGLRNSLIRYSIRNGETKIVKELIRNKTPAEFVRLWESGNLNIGTEHMYGELYHLYRLVKEAPEGANSQAWPDSAFKS